MRSFSSPVTEWLGTERPFPRNATLLQYSRLANQKSKSSAASDGPVELLA